MRFVALNEVAKIDRTVASDEECNILPYVGLDHIEKDMGRFAVEFEREPEALLATKFRFTSRHVLYGKLRPYLNKVALPSFDGVCTTEILPILPEEDKLDRIYLWAFLLTPGFVEWASSNVSGANLPRLSPKLLATCRIPLPPLPEQKRIAAILSKADRLRRLRRYARELSDGYLGSVFLEMFGDPVTNPMGWEVHKLGKHLTFITSGGRGWAKYYSPSGDRFIRSFDVQMNHISDSDTVFVNPPDKAEARRTKVQQGDVLLTVTGSRIGRVAPVPGTIGKAYISQHVAILRLDDKLRPDFVSMFLSLDRCGQQQIQQLQYGQTKPGLGFEQIRSFNILVPPLVCQERFSQIIQKYERLRAQQREAERQAEHLLQSLLHQAFRGDL